LFTKEVEGMIYLLHYDRPLHHAQHYLGFTDDLDARTARHLNGFGGRLPAVFLELGISFTIARNLGWRPEAGTQTQEPQERAKTLPDLPEGEEW
jgi:hypothetical protein